MSDSSRKSIPSWQRESQSGNEKPVTENQNTSDPASQSKHAELLEQAREFLKEESISKAPRERKVAFLKEKGLQDNDIDELLSEKPSTIANSSTTELKTVHDSNTTDDKTKKPSEGSSEKSTPVISSEPQNLPQRPQRDIPPIITYPEFLLKPQKPPPLITISRLVDATYAFAGLASLTYGANKYLVEPMLDTLTEARLSLASTTLADLEKLNTKLESTVSHVPYIPSAGALRKAHDQTHAEGDDSESITSDPTELFHRDIATQTTPNLSRKNSINEDKKEHLDATTQHVMRLSSLHETLTSLIASIDPQEVAYLPPPANKKLRNTMSDFQTVIDKLESSYHPLRGEYYSSIYAQPADNKAKAAGKDNDMAAKVRNEIRNLKGAFLSARNFPTAPRPPMNTYGSR